MRNVVPVEPGQLSFRFCKVRSDGRNGLSVMLASSVEFRRGDPARRDRPGSIPTARSAPMAACSCACPRTRSTRRPCQSSDPLQQQVTLWQKPHVEIAVRGRDEHRSHLALALAGREPIDDNDANRCLICLALKQRAWGGRPLAS